MRIDSFLLGRTEVTRAQYHHVMAAKPASKRPPEAASDKQARISPDPYPMQDVPWIGAIRFCNALSRAERLEPYYVEERREGSLNRSRGFEMSRDLAIACPRRPNGNMPLVRACAEIRLRRRSVGHW